MRWNKKHDQFARSGNFSQSMEHLARWQLRRAKPDQPTEIEINLRDFNKEVGKNRFRGEYHLKTLTTAMNRLDSDSHGMFTIIKKYSPWIYRILVRPLSFVNELWGAKRASTRETTTAQPMFDANHKDRIESLLLQNISKLDTLLKSVGVVCNSETLHRLWRHAGKKMQNVQKAVEYMLFSHANKLYDSTDPEEKGIRVPAAWLVSCLKHNRQESYDPYYQSDLPFIGTTSKISEFVRGIMPVDDSPPSQKVLLE